MSSNFGLPAFVPPAAKAAPPPPPPPPPLSEEEARALNRLMLHRPVQGAAGAAWWNPGTCRVCGKMDTPEHLTGKVHREKEAEASFLDGLLGRAVSNHPRSLSTVAAKPFYGDLSWSALCAHWGCDLGMLAEKAKEVLRRNGGHLSVNGKHMTLTAEAISQAKFEGGFVPYSGQGKYDPRNSFIPFKAINGHPHQRWVQPPVNVPVGWGWWPVLAITETGLDLRVGEQIMVVGGTLCIVCVLQWGWPIPTGWWITVQPLQSRM